MGAPPAAIHPAQTPENWRENRSPVFKLKSFSGAERDAAGKGAVAIGGGVEQILQRAASRRLHAIAVGDEAAHRLRVDSNLVGGQRLAAVGQVGSARRMKGGDDAVATQRHVARGVEPDWRIAAVDEHVVEDGNARVAGRGGQLAVGRDCAQRDAAVALGWRRPE